jgi:hypothetical protein
MKTCFRCKLEKPFSDFFPNKKRKDNVSTYCKPCQLEYARTRYNNPENHKQIKMDRNLYLSNRKDSTRKWYLKTTYGLTQEEYSDLYAKSDGKCYICFESKSYYLHVDHNHTTGKIRGLLCHSCNVGIGMLKDSPELLSLAARYLLDNG